MKGPHPHPPAFYQKLFRWFCKSHLYHELQGDLHEEFLQNTDELGLKKARQLYKKEVIRMIRPSVIRKSSKLKNPMMFSLAAMNFKLAIRNMIKHKVFSAVNVFGLAAALCVSLFIVNLIYTGFQLDSHHNDLDRLHRVVNYVSTTQDGRQLYASIPYRAADLLKEDIPDIEALTHIRTGLTSTFKVNGEEVSARGIKTDEAFFEIFSFETIAGNPLEAISEVNSIIITDELANKYFPNGNALGKQTEDGRIVKAIIASPKRRSHLQFEIIGKIDSPGNGGSASSNPEYDWGFYYRDFAYLKLRESSDAETFNSKLKPFSDKANKLHDTEELEYEFSSQPVKGLVYGDPGLIEPGLIIGKEGLLVYSVMIMVMILIASFNYTNLSIARAIQRTKEIGIRKVSGSTNGQIIGQMLCETLLLSFLSLAIGLSIYKLVSNDFMSINPFIAKAFNPDLSLEILLIFVAFTTLAGLLAGIFPALFFARINPLNLFNPRMKGKRLSFLGMRKVLITFQLTLSMFAIMFMILLSSQVSLLKDAPTGFDTSGRLIVRSNAKNAPLLKSAFEQISGVEAITITSDVPGDITNAVVSFYDPLENDSSIKAMSLWADKGLFDVLNPRLLEGNFFNENIVAGAQREIVVNEKFLSLIQTDVPSSIGKVLKNQNGEFKIVGVLDGMIMSNPFLPQALPVIIIAGKERSNQSILVLKTDTKSVPNTLMKLEVEWNKLHPDDKFKAEELQTFLNKPMLEFENIIRMLQFIAIAIIAIALLGQLGMAMYNAETRVKEIGIRKVLGAKIRSIIQLLLKGTIVPLLIASLISAPVAYSIFVDGLANSLRTPLEPGIGLFLKAIFLLTGVILVVVVSQTWRVARLNPTESLRSE